MPEVSTYNFDLTELTETLIRASGVTEGRWMVGVNFAINAGAIGQNPKESKPGVVTLIEGLTLSRVPDNQEDNNLFVNASKVKPLK